jgi:hypothetical protein
MKVLSRSLLTASSLALALLIGTVPAPAQEDDAEDARPVSFYVEIADWISQASGLGFKPATRLDPADPFGTLVLTPTNGTEAEIRAVGAVDLGRNGAFAVSWYTHSQNDIGMTTFRPGEMVFGEVLAHPLYAGVNNDGLSDAFEMTGSASLKDVRVDYRREAFRSRRVVGTWFAGGRYVEFSRAEEVVYHTLISGLPSLIPPLTDPRPDLDPLPDSAAVTSDFTGNGIEGGLDLSFLVLEDKLSLEGGFALAALRSTIDSRYRSTTHFYTSDITGEEVILGPDDYEEAFGGVTEMGGEEVANVDFVSQDSFPIGLRSNSLRTSSLVIDTYLGLRWKALKWLDVIGGFRNTYYGDVAVELRPKQVTSTPVGFNIEDIDEVPISVEYEGFYFGVGFSF